MSTNGWPERPRLEGKQPVIWLSTGPDVPRPPEMDDDLDTWVAYGMSDNPPVIDPDAPIVWTHDRRL